jgi:transketolase
LIKQLDFFKTISIILPFLRFTIKDPEARSLLALWSPHITGSKMTPISITTHPCFETCKLMANAIRILAMDAVEKAQSGHPGMPMGMADIATVLFSDFMKFNPQDPLWPDRDRFILSNGHGSMLLYALSYLTGYEEMTLDQLKSFRQFGSITAGHPELHRRIGVETTTGPLGQGMGNAVGMALAERILAAEFGEDLVNHYTYVCVGDGCLMEGISHEVASLAGHLGLEKLIVFFDDNAITIDGDTNLSNSENHQERFQSYGWHTQTIDGHNHQEIFEAISSAQEDPRPSFIACKTTIGYGAPQKGGTAAAHGSPLGPEEVQRVRKNFNWPHPPFEVPTEILDLWRNIGLKSRDIYQAWQKTLQNSSPALQETFHRRLKGELPSTWKESLYDKIRAFSEKQPTIATRQSSGEVIEMLMTEIPELIGGSADLGGSTNVKTKQSKVISRDHYKGNYIYYGVREHGMASTLNGLALHGGIIPFGSTFLVFSDYCRPSIRLAALMKQHVIFVMTHDSIGLGEDGPTHQPIEHLASLRAIPNLLVMRPADAVEVAECWMSALEHKSGPSLIALTRQAVPTLRHTYLYGENLSQLGGYVIRGSATHLPHVTLLATGSEVALAIDVQKKLEELNIPAQVASLPCWALFDQQPQNYQDQVLGRKNLRIAIEAASPLGWEKYVQSPHHIIGLSSFGASANGHTLYQHFGFTIENIVRSVQQQLQEIL